MIPRTGERHRLNQEAHYQMMTEPMNSDDATVPTLIIGGVRVSAYVDSTGRVCVTVYTDEEELSPAIWQANDAVAMKIIVNDTTVFEEL